LGSIVKADNFIIKRCLILASMLGVLDKIHAYWSLGPMTRASV
jgi:hypothetical protein